MSSALPRGTGGDDRPSRTICGPGVGPPGSARLVRRTGTAASVVRPGNELTLVTNQLARREAEAAAGDDVQPVGGGCEQQPA